jgi:hypothetical protein
MRAVIQEQTAVPPDHIMGDFELTISPALTTSFIYNVM